MKKNVVSLFAHSLNALALNRTAVVSGDDKETGERRFFIVTRQHQGYVALPAPLFMAMDAAEPFKSVDLQDGTSMWFVPVAHRADAMQFCEDYPTI